MAPALLPVTRVRPAAPMVKAGEGPGGVAWTGPAGMLAAI